MQARKADMVIRNVDPYDHISSNRIQNNTMQMATGAGGAINVIVKPANFTRAAAGRSTCKVFQILTTYSVHVHVHVPSDHMFEASYRGTLGIRSYGVLARAHLLFNIIRTIKTFQQLALNLRL